MRAKNAQWGLCQTEAALAINAAARVLAERDAGPAFGFRGPEQLLADAWTAIASRQPAQGAKLFLEAALGDAFDAPTREAWVTAYNLVAETMLEGAASARPIGA
jgi:hypothetical protein